MQEKYLTAITQSLPFPYPWYRFFVRKGAAKVLQCSQDTISIVVKGVKYKMHWKEASKLAEIESKFASLDEKEAIYRS